MNKGSIYWHDYETWGINPAEDKPSPVLNGRDYLYPASEFAINFLQERSDKGFFLMIEGSQIDWGK